MDEPRFPTRVLTDEDRRLISKAVATGILTAFLVIALLAVAAGAVYGGLMTYTKNQDRAMRGR